MSIRHYNVYKNNVCVLEDETAAIIAKDFKISKDYFYKTVRAGKQINGCDIIELDTEGEAKESVSEEDKETRRFINVYGISAYREWLTLNIRYGGRVHG